MRLPAGANRPCCGRAMQLQNLDCCSADALASRDHRVRAHGGLGQAPCSPALHGDAICERGQRAFGRRDGRAVHGRAEGARAVQLQQLPCACGARWPQRTLNVRGLWSWPNRRTRPGRAGSPGSGQCSTASELFTCCGASQQCTGAAVAPEMGSAQSKARAISSSCGRPA